MATFDREKFLDDRREHSQKLEESYEVSVVRHLINRLRTSPTVADEIRLFNKQAIDRDNLNLAGFNNARVFPLWLVSAKIPHLDSDYLQRLMTKPTKNSIIERFAEFRSEYPTMTSSNTLGMVFAWPSWSPFMLLHCVDSIPECRLPRIWWYPRVGKHRELHVLEPLDNYLEGAGLLPSKEDDA